MSNTPKILAVEPSNLSIPYLYLSEHYTLRRVTTITAAVHTLSATPPDLVLISSAFTLHESVRLLEILKEHSVKKLIPVIFVVDFRHRIIMLPGTSWAGQLGLLHGYASDQEIQATITRLLHPAPPTRINEQEKMLELLESAREFQVSTVLDEDPEDDYVPRARESTESLPDSPPDAPTSPVEDTSSPDLSPTETTQTPEAEPPHAPLKPLKPLSHFTADSKTKF